MKKRGIMGSVSTSKLRHTQVTHKKNIRIYLEVVSKIGKNSWPLLWPPVLT